MKTLLRLWLVCSAAWVAVVYWAYSIPYDGVTDPIPWNYVLGLPGVVLVLLVALRWAFGGFNRRST